ncbi:helix-turn-helix domain-containing protein [Bacillus toyonensis]|uniref:helix-turn-helix domain-containing protein n=1 Tax=Bacillus toyonensis TaxID=155322 RepID=UPI000BF335ED|nr:helix-turn-helix transcriptional regulator [Bacillus toyonensis]PGC93934.1 XRE family transcriptional regulator [Bacillus toyonensis]
MPSKLGVRIKEMRKEAKLSQKQLGEKANVTESFISKIESGAKKPSIEVISKFAEILSVSVDYLLGHSDHKSLDREKSQKVEKDVTELMERINKLSPEKRQVIINLIDNY